MIAQRFRPVGWVVGVAIAATALYIVSLQVATERTRLETIDRKIAAAKRDIRQLQTELGTRASLRQLERWNGEVLALSSPESQQFLTGEAALANLDGTKLPQPGFAPPPVMVAATSATATATAAAQVATLENASSAKPVIVAKSSVQVAAKAPKPRQIALLDRTLVDHRTLGEIMREAASEARTKDKRE